MHDENYSVQIVTLFIFHPNVKYIQEIFQVKLEWSFIVEPCYFLQIRSLQR